MRFERMIPNARLLLPYQLDQLTAHGFIVYEQDQGPVLTRRGQDVLYSPVDERREEILA